MHQFHYYAPITTITGNFWFLFIFKEFNSKHEKDSFEVGHTSQQAYESVYKCYEYIRAGAFRFD